MPTKQADAKKLVNKFSTIQKQKTQLKKSVSPKCKKFCADVFIPKFKKQFGSALDKKVAPKKSVLDNEFKECLRYYCNPTCKKDLFLVQPQHKDGWDLKFTKKQKSTLKSKGALSGCDKNYRY